MSENKEEFKGVVGLLTVIVKYILGPLVAAILAWGFAADRSDKNHAQSSKGYEVVAGMVNQHEQRLDNIEKVLQRVELQTKAASQPAISLNGPIVIPGGRVDPWPHMGLKAPRLSKTVVTVNPKYAPSSMPASAPVKAAKGKSAHPLRQVPVRLRDVK